MSPTLTLPPSSTPAADAATETLGNAIRLYRDARLLFEHERYASCASVSVLAIEELAKFMALAGFQVLRQDEWRCHTSKHLSSASFLLRSRYQAALREMLAEHQVPEPAAMYARLAAMQWQPDEMSLFDAVLAKIVADGSLRRFSQTYEKELNRLKQLGFYVDLNDQGRVETTPRQVTREIAEDHVGFVCDVLKALRTRMPEATAENTALIN